MGTNIELDKSQIGEVEESIAPPMRDAISFPVVVDSVPTDVTVYVCCSPWGPRDNWSSRLVREVARKLYVREEV